MIFAGIVVLVLGLGFAGMVFCLFAFISVLAFVVRPLSKFLQLIGRVLNRKII